MQIKAQNAKKPYLHYFEITTNKTPDIVLFFLPTAQIYVGTSYLKENFKLLRSHLLPNNVQKKLSLKGTTQYATFAPRAGYTDSPKLNPS